MKKLINIVLILGLVSGISAQDVNQVLAVRKLERNKTKAKSVSQVYDDKGYMRYVNHSTTAESEEMDVVVLRKIANAYRMNADYENAEDWYVKFVNPSSIKEDILHYAQTLQANGRCKEAVQWFDVYKSKVGTQNQSDFDFIEDCSELEDFNTHTAVSLMNMTSLNTEGLDFSPCKTKDGIYITSNRGEMQTKSDAWTNSNFTDIYLVDGNGSMTASPATIGGQLNDKYHDGVLTFSPDENTMYFTRNDERRNKKNSFLNLKIFQTTKSGSSWTAVKELPFNSDEYSTAHPTISKDGTTMYFSSNRPGGYGGMDIYMSKNISGNWSTPVNLGQKINSEGNEIFPFITDEEVLIFSSNGHAGFGGLDLFAAKAKNNTWNERKNCGKPFNSIKDDFGFFIDEDDKNGYISSNRPGGMGKDDIYSFTSTEDIDFFEKASVERTICFVEKGSNKKIGNVNINLKNTTNNSFGVSFESDDKGFFTHEMFTDSQYDFDISKEGYETSSIRINPTELLNTENECHLIEMEKSRPLTMNGVVMEKGTSNVLASTKVEVKNSCTGKSTKLNTDANGKFKFDIDCNCDYELIAQKSAWTKDIQKFSTKKDCAAVSRKTMKLNLSPNKKVSAPKVITNKLIGNKKISEGMLIELKNIYYDYNKANIRSDATIDLDNLSDLMKQYPSMEVELGSHTDARGSDTYNMELSTKRAAAARQYLIAKGISSNRLSSRGYGETQLLNQCKNGVTCDDAAHQQNRRTEVKVTKFNNKDVNIKYRN